jgi:hypothetical protein
MGRDADDSPNKKQVSDAGGSADADMGLGFDVPDERDAPEEFDRVEGRVPTQADAPDTPPPKAPGRGGAGANA